MAAEHPLTSGGFTYALVDANALLAPRLSDVLFDMHMADMFRPRWTSDIEAEFLRNWGKVMFPPKKRKLLGAKTPSQTEMDKRANRRLGCFQDAVGAEYEIFGHGDEKVRSKVPAKVHVGDIHVVAAAVALKQAVDEFEPHSKVFLITKNIRHMAVKQVKTLGIEVVRPGAFIDMFLVQPATLEKTLMRTVNDLQNPPYSKAQLLGALQVHGAAKTVAHFEARWGVVAAVT